MAVSHHNLLRADRRSLVGIDIAVRLTVLPSSQCLYERVHGRRAVKFARREIGYLSVFGNDNIFAVHNIVGIFFKRRF